MNKVYFIIPAYNEETNIKQVMETWYNIVLQCGPDSRLIIIDDGSKDSTYSIMKEFSQSHPQFEAITKQNSGHGATILYGYHYTISQHADYVFQTDSDGQTNPEEFLNFWELRNDYDMVIGQRTKRQDGLSRLFVAKTLKNIIFFCFHVKIADANTPFRLMKADTLAKYIDLIPIDCNLTNVMISIIFAKKKCQVHYIPITFKPRQGGVNSIDLKKIIKIGGKALHDFILMRPKI